MQHSAWRFRIVRRLACWPAPRLAPLLARWLGGVVTAAACLLGTSCGLAAPCMLATPAFASDVTPKDVQVIGRTLGFLEDATAGTLDLGIVYLPDNAESVRQATAMQGLLGGGVAAGKLVLRPRLVAADQLGKLDHVGALFIVPAAGQAADTAIAAARRLHVPTISTDIACAEAGDCVLAFHSEPTVEVFLSRSAAAEAGVRFTPAFRMLVRQM